MAKEATEYKAIYKKSTGTEITVGVRPFIQIPNGTEGVKFLADVTSSHDHLRRHTRQFFIKRSNELPGCPETQHGAILEKYKWLKENGFPVPPTYRYDSQNREFLITDMTQFGEIYDKTNPLRKTMKNMDQVIEEIKIIAKKTFHDGNGVFLGLDAYSIIVDSKNNGHIYLLDLGRGAYRLHDGVDEKGRTKLPQNAEAIAQAFIDRILTTQKPASLG